jgi:hypothetical protein
VSEPIWTVIEVRIPATWVGEPRKVTSRWGGHVSWETHDVLHPAFDALREYMSEDSSWDPDRSVFRFAGDANYGLAESEVVTPFLDWCEANHVPYHAHDDTKYEFSGETRVFDGHNEVVSFHNDGDSGGAVLTWSDYFAIGGAQYETVSGEKKGEVVDDATLGARVRAHFAQDRPLEEFDISHLPEHPPVDVDA